MCVCVCVKLNLTDILPKKKKQKKNCQTNK